MNTDKGPAQKGEETGSSSSTTTEQEEAGGKHDFHVA
jgi:hypothetical protein